MSPKDKRFFIGFIIGCLVCIVLVKVVFLGGTSKTSAVESIIESGLNVTNANVFAYENRGDDKVCAFTFTDENGSENMGITVLNNNMRGSYTVGQTVFAETDAEELYMTNAVVNDTRCAVFACTADSTAASAEIKIIKADDGRENTLKTNLEPKSIAFIAYSNDPQADGEKTVNIYDKNKELISSGK